MMTRTTSAVRKPKIEDVLEVPTVTFIFVPAKLNVLQHWNLGSPVDFLSPPSASKESFLPLLFVTKELVVLVARVAVSLVGTTVVISSAAALVLLPSNASEFWKNF